MENEPAPAQDDGRKAKKGRLMGKLFGHRKAAVEEPTGNSPGDLNDFFRGSTDRLDVSHPAPPKPPQPPKLDISRVTRYPNALDVAGNTQQGLPLGPPSHNPPKIRRNRGLLVVRFVDTFPEIMGVGGDDCEIPTVEIGKRKPVKAIRPPAITTRTAPLYNAQMAIPPPQNQDNFVPQPLRRTQTGHTSIPGARGPEWPVIPAGEDSTTNYLDKPVVSQDDRRRSFIEIHQAEMREAEGLAFAKAQRADSASPGPSFEERRQTPPAQQMPQTPTSQMRQLMLTESPEQVIPPALSVQTHDVYNPYQPPPLPHSQPPSASETSPSKPPYPLGSPDKRILQGPFFEQSPSSVYSQSSSFAQRQVPTRQGSKLSDVNDHVSSPRDAGLAAEGGALDTFVLRTRHLFALFRLHAEMHKPLTSYAPADVMRAALWWFLRGRMALEVAVRERPTSSQGQEKNEFAKQQAYADLAKGYWLSQDAFPDIRESQRLPVDPDVDEARKNLKASLEKLSLSMQRNGFLPPEEAFLPQTIDKFIWIEYPPLSQDIVALLSGSSSSALGQMQMPGSGMSILETLPIGDSAQSFCFGRVHVDAILMEQGGHESQRLYLPCLLSIVRPQKHPDLMFVIASQNGAVQLRIQGNRNAGPVWDDVRWRSDACCLDIRLPRGFILVVQCSQSDFRLLWNMHDFSAKVQSSLYPRQGEQCVFRSTLKAFQYFDNDPQARQFPKESTPSCDIGLYERVLREDAATGPRCFHGGYRIAVVTGTTTKTLSGVNQVYLPQQPVQYGFLRGDQNDPALSLKFENGRQKGSMVMTFKDDKERLRVHNLLAGTMIRPDEHVFCEVPLRGVWFAKYFGDVQSFQSLSSLPWERVRVINDAGNGDRPPCVLSDKLRIVFESKEGTMTDRVNVAPGELKLRLDVANPTCLMLYRQPQADFTVAVTEAKVSRELSQGLTKDLEALQQFATLRTYMFPTLPELHQFQEAMTGYKVVFDGFASTFAISRRRMVVPIHKKWEAGPTRIQVVQQDRVTHLLAFFDEFSHGKCMSFALKGTDQYEAFGKGSKTGVKFDDAKFPLPKMPADGEDANSIQVTADTAFVCLDLPELPGEHDDISITFENEAGKLFLPLWSLSLRSEAD
jgi:hypothetical protein